MFHVAFYLSSSAGCFCRSKIVYKVTLSLLSSYKHNVAHSYLSRVNDLPELAPRSTDFSLFVKRAKRNEIKKGREGCMTQAQNENRQRAPKNAMKTEIFC